MGKDEFHKCVADLSKDIRGDNEFMATLDTFHKDKYTRECTDHLDANDCKGGFSEYFVGLADSVLAHNNKSHLSTEKSEMYQRIQRNHLHHAEYHERKKCGGVSPTTSSLTNLAQNIELDFRLPSMGDFSNMWVFDPRHNWLQNLTKLLNLMVIAVIIYMVANVLLQMMSRGGASTK